MELREESEVVVLLAKLALPLSAPCSGWSEEGKNRFWNHVRYLEHLWSKEMSRPELCSRERNQLIEEILVTQLLIRITAAVAARQDRHKRKASTETSEDPLEWRSHLNVVETLIGRFRSQVNESTVLHQARLQRRLEYWGDFLLSRSTGVDAFVTNCRSRDEFFEGDEVSNEASWTLLTAGLSRVIPNRKIVDLSRAAVHRRLLQMAIRLVPKELFMADGHLKPCVLRIVQDSVAIQ